MLLGNIEDLIDDEIIEDDISIYHRVNQQLERRRGRGRRRKSGRR